MLVGSQISGGHPPLSLTVAHLRDLRMIGFLWLQDSLPQVATRVLLLMYLVFIRIRGFLSHLTKLLLLIIGLYEQLLLM